MQASAPITPKLDIDAETLKNDQWIENLLNMTNSVSPDTITAFESQLSQDETGEATLAELLQLTPQHIEKLAELGHIKFQRGNYEKAEIAFRFLVLVDPENPYHHLMLGAIFQKNQQYFDAIAEYTLVLELDPQCISAYVNRGEVYFQSTYFHDALADFEKAIELDTSGKDPWANRARFLKAKALEELQS